MSYIRLFWMDRRREASYISMVWPAAVVIMSLKRQVSALRVLSGLDERQAEGEGEWEGEERRWSGLGESCSMKRGYLCMIVYGEALWRAFAGVSCDGGQIHNQA